MMKRILFVCTTDSMIWNFLIPHIKDLESKGYYVECACSITGDFYHNLVTQYEVKMNQICFKRSPYNISNIKAYRDLKKIVQEKNFDAVFCHEPVGGAIGRLVGHKMHCKVLYMAHGFHFYKGAPLINRCLYYTVEKFLSRYTDVLITLNEEDYQAALKFHSKKVFKVNGIGIDTSKFSKIDNCRCLQSELNLKSDDFLLVSVGELIKRKNHLVIIEALKQINNPRIHLAIAGDGELREYLERKIDKLGLKNQIHLLGYRTDVNKLCNSADAFIMPSLQEGLSVAIMEAMSCGKPIIASKIRGNIDLIDDNKGGILVNPKDVSGFIKAITCFYEMKDNLKKYGLYNIDKVQEFDIGKVKQQFFSVYEEL